MNLGFLDSPHIWDGLFLLIFVLCVSISARRGALGALSGIAGSILGVLLGNLYQDDLSPLVEKLISPTIRGMVSKTDLSQAAGLEEGSLLDALVQQSSTLSDKLGQLYQHLLEEISRQVTACLAPIIAFLFIFLMTKLIIFLVCRLMKLGIPVVSGINRTAGGLLGACSGALIIVTLCWALMQFSPAGQVGLLSQGCLQKSWLGGWLSGLVANAPHL